MFGKRKEAVVAVAEQAGVPLEHLCIVAGKTGPGEQNIELCRHRVINASGNEAVHLCAAHANGTCPLGYKRVSTLDAIPTTAWPRPTPVTGDVDKPR